MSVKLRFNLARDLFETFPEIRKDLSAEPDDQPSLDFMSELTVSTTPENAVTFCAYLLPRREAVWWGHQCLSQLPENLMPEDLEFMKFAEDWVRQPEDAQRILALNAAMDVDDKTPAVWLSLAAGWSGGSMVADEMSPLPPPPYMTAKAVNIAILSTLATVDMASRAEFLRNFVDIGAQLATGDSGE